MNIAMRKSLAIVVVLTCVFVRNIHCVCVSCYLPPNATEKDLEQLFLMDFKRRLLEKLGLKTEPKVDANPPMPIIKALTANDGMLAGDQSRQKIEKSSKITDVVLGPYQTTNNISQNMLSCKFKLDSEMMKGAYEVAGVKLWLYLKKAPTKTHWFQVYEKMRLRRRLVLNDSFNSYSAEWTEFKFVPSKTWNKTPWKKLHLEIEGIYDTSNQTVLFAKGNEPHLQVLTRPIKQRLSKRNSARTSRNKINDCGDNGRCCKHSMTLNVQAQMPWFIHPKIIQAGVCRGKCPHMYRSRWAWTSLTQIQHNKQPCCVPTKLSPMSTLIKRNGKIYRSEVQNMLVDSCGCS